MFQSVRHGFFKTKQTLLFSEWSERVKKTEVGEYPGGWAGVAWV